LASVCLRIFISTPSSVELNASRLILEGHGVVFRCTGYQQISGSVVVVRPVFSRVAYRELAPRRMSCLKISISLVNPREGTFIAFDNQDIPFLLY